jgi:hypothetical protein
LLDVLRLLSPHLPPGFDPHDQSLSTLSEVLALSKKLALADALDKKFTAPE